MNVSPNSTNGSTNREELADLTQNHDEVLDLELAMGALGGIRHSAACDAAERSTRRFDERNHRFHESRMQAMGMEGEEKELETDMTHQVLIRSPIIHNHYPATNQPQQPQQSNQPTSQPTTNQSQPIQPGQQPAQPQPNGLSNLTKAALLASALGLPMIGWWLGGFMRDGDTFISNPVLPGDMTGIENVPAGPPNPDRAKLKKTSP